MAGQQQPTEDTSVDALAGSGAVWSNAVSGKGSAVSATS